VKRRNEVGLIVSGRSTRSLSDLTDRSEGKPICSDFSVF
jgi:hypothetical protein